MKKMILTAVPVLPVVAANAVPGWTARAGVNAGDVRKFVIGVRVRYGMADIAGAEAVNLHNINDPLVSGYKFR